MPINIDTLTENELRDLHHRITERLRLIRQLHAHAAMMEFAIGDRVTFNADGRRVAGIITRYNRKSVTGIAEGGQRWNVAPGLLMRSGAQATSPPPEVTIVVKGAHNSASHSAPDLHRRSGEPM